MAVRQRPVQADYLKIGEDWELMKLSFTKLNEKPNAKTKEKRYVDQTNATSTIVGYGWTQPFEADQIIGDKVIEYIREIAELCKTGAETETEKLIVDMDKPSNEDGGYRARKFNVAIKVDELTDNDGEMGITGEFVGQGNPVLGTFNKETKTFTEGFTPKA